MHRHKEHAFSLMELLIWITLIGIIYAVAMPHFHEFMRKNNIATHAHQLVTIINYTRTLAIMQNKVISICPSIDGLSCSNDWSDGLLVFIDKSQDQQFDQTLGDIALHYVSFASINKQIKIHWNRTPFLQFDANGNLLGQNGTFHYCFVEKGKSAESASIAVVLSLTGRVRISASKEGC